MVLWASSAPPLSHSQGGHSVCSMYSGCIDRSGFLLAGGTDMRLRFWDLNTPNDSHVALPAANDVVPPNSYAYELVFNNALKICSRNRQLYGSVVHIFLRYNCSQTTLDRRYKCGSRGISWRLFHALVRWRQQCQRKKSRGRWTRTGNSTIWSSRHYIRRSYVQYVYTHGQYRRINTSLEMIVFFHRRSLYVCSSFCNISFPLCKILVAKRICKFTNNGTSTFYIHETPMVIFL